MRIARLLVCVGLMAALSSPALAQSNPAVRLKGGTDRRAVLDPMQLHAFDQGLWGSLTKWSGTPVTAESTKGKVVLIVTWASYYKPTLAAMAVAQAAQAKYGDKGLVVVGVHNPQGFEMAEAAAKDKGITFAYALDEQSKVRSALKVVQDPEFYVLDRAGNMRYAGVEAGSLDAAVSALIRETKEQAAAIPEQLKEAANKMERDRLRTGDITGAPPWQSPVVEFTDPPEEAYQNISWPKMPYAGAYGDASSDLAKKIEINAPMLPIPDEGWIPAKPPTRGKIIVAYLVTPLIPETMNAIPTLNRLQEQFPRDVVVLGEALEIKDEYLRGTQEEKELQRKNAVEATSRIPVARQMNHAFCTTQFKLSEIVQGANSFFMDIKSREDTSIGFIVSSDGKVRWVGNPNYQNFRVAVEQAVRNDPGVNARRRAEEAAGKAP